MPIDLTSQTSRIVIFVGIAVVVAIIGTIWYMSVSADERIRELEMEKAVIQDRLERSREEADRRVEDYRDLVGRFEAAESRRQEQLNTLATNLQIARSEIVRLRGEVQEQQQRTERQIESIASTTDVQLAAEIESELQEKNEAAQFIPDQEAFFTNRPGAEVIRERFLEHDLADFTLERQRGEITSYATQVQNLKQQVTIHQESIAECNGALAACKAAVQGFEAERREWEESVRVRDEQIDALIQKSFWQRFKKWGTIVGVAAVSFEVGRRVEGN